MRKQVSIVLISNMPFILHLLTISILIDCVKTTHMHKPESNFRDPIVWNLGSLYEEGKQSNTLQSMSISRRKRSTSSNNPQRQQQQQMVDACQSKMEVLTPYYATNSKGKLRTIVNSELMQQAIQVETCSRSTVTGQNASKCSAQPDCGCEQKYKWHRLLVLDPRDTTAAKGLFMDWFLFPSNCVCRCRSSPGSNRQFLRTIKNRTESDLKSR